MWNVFTEKSTHSTYEGRGEEAHNKTSENLYGFFYEELLFCPEEIC